MPAARIIYNVSLNTNDYLTELWSRYFETAQQDAQKAEAFSTAVWEIVYENNPANWDITSWNDTEQTGFKCSGLAGGMASLANSWLGSLDGSVLTEQLAVLQNDCKQDYIAKVPEPGTIAILMAGSVFIIAKRKTCKS